MKPFALTPGIYAISATLLQGMGSPVTGPWNKAAEANYQHAWKNIEIYHQKLRLSRRCAWLRHQPRPGASVGHSILIWHLDEAELAAALSGPPVELAEAPLRP